MAPAKLQVFQSGQPQLQLQGAWQGRSRWSKQRPKYSGGKQWATSGLLCPHQLVPTLPADCCSAALQPVPRWATAVWGATTAEPQQLGDLQPTLKLESEEVQLKLKFWPRLRLRGCARSGSGEPSGSSAACAATSGCAIRTSTSHSVPPPVSCASTPPTTPQLAQG